ncbi:hypothetical protein [Geobacillus sp. YHL]|uniref:hypothetical protein n=1 Tax=Geobacillus sp. YHL TaxID=2796117 RepID=UPI001EF05CB0|nr:hypothetical protein [Geobacillus sp. YHL]MCG6796585.1 hypothetical protein [Geobacillus sp. YHL]
MANGQPFVVRMVLPKDADQVATFAKAVAGGASCLRSERKQRSGAATNLRVAVQMGRLVEMQGQ